jgi:hypothetical protein
MKSHARNLGEAGYEKQKVGFAVSKSADVGVVT